MKNAKFELFAIELMKFINSIEKKMWLFLTKKLRLENGAKDSKTVQRSALCRSRRELSNEYLLAKIGVDTAENEPLEVWGKIIQYYSFVSLDTNPGKFIAGYPR